MSWQAGEGTGAKRFDARRAYDRIGRLQDTQALYERPAIADLVARMDLGKADRLLDVGCGTGKLAARLLGGPLPPRAIYVGTDVSERMVQLSKTRLRPFGDRARVVLVNSQGDQLTGMPRFDRAIAAYVFDLLTSEETRRLLAEIHDHVDPRGILGVVNITAGSTGVPALVSRAWTALWRRVPGLVGGCRPVQLVGPLQAAGFTVRHRTTVTAWGVTSEVTTATPAYPT